MYRISQPIEVYRKPKNTVAGVCWFSNTSAMCSDSPSLGRIALTYPPCQDTKSLGSVIVVSVEVVPTWAVMGCGAKSWCHKPCLLESRFKPVIIVLSSSFQAKFITVFHPRNLRPVYGKFSTPELENNVLTLKGKVWECYMWPFSTQGRWWCSRLKKTDSSMCSSSRVWSPQNTVVMTMAVSCHKGPFVVFVLVHPFCGMLVPQGMQGLSEWDEVKLQLAHTK